MSDNGPGRRDFLKYMGATVAGLHTAACIRKPKEHILPFAKRPEDLIPGVPRDYATSWHVGGSVLGLVVRSTDGRPTKIEGNPLHPMSHGGTNSWAQASVLALYAPERSRTAYQGGQPIQSDAVATFLGGVKKQLDDSQGQGFAVLVDDHPSPTLHRLLAQLRAHYPKAVLYSHDGGGEENALAGAALVGMEGISFTPSGRPHIIAAFDADVLATEGDVVAFNRLFAHGRRPDDADSMNRLYVAEPAFTLTGANADHRLAVAGAQIGDLLAAVAGHLRQGGLALPALPVPADKNNLPFVKVLAEDLLAAKGKSLVVVGERQPPPVHALGQLINNALGNFGHTLKFVHRPKHQMGTLAALAEQIRNKSVKQLLILGGNPAFDAPGDLGFAELLGQVPMSVHLGMHRDETGTLCTVHLPKTHYLEEWGDLVARDGTLSIQQPLIAPLYPACISEIELLGRLFGQSNGGYELTRETHQARAGVGFEKSWQRWLHDGVVTDAHAETATPHASDDKLASAWKPAAAAQGLELNFVRDASILDGRFGGSPWLQELPDPVTKLVWDNAALIAPGTAAKLGVKSGDLVQVSHHGKELRIAAWVQAGTAEDTVVMPLGYGRTQGGNNAKAGFDVGPLRQHASPYILTGATVSRAGGDYVFSTPQPETSEHDRNIVRHADIASFIDDPDFVEEAEVVEPDLVKSLLWKEPNQKEGHQWGMSIDLNSCTSCGACTVACQAENNIPWVGKDEVRRGRVMHWIRVDRYLDEENGKLAFKGQPMACAQCETAPCENVCPVAATSHSPEGLNDMAYNRCIGTRYCANNCPYKVRRFNFYNFNLRNDEEYGLGIAMQRNPDVTVRFRGVMEKCTYCVQKIQRARIDSKVRGDLVIKDGAIVPSCAAVCPTNAITFGDLNDKESRVSKQKESPRNYAVLAELNIRPRTTYLARISNPNPKLGKG